MARAAINDDKLECYAERALPFIVSFKQTRAQSHRLFQKLSNLALDKYIIVEGTKLPVAGDGVLCRFDFLIILPDVLYRSTVRSICQVLLGRCLGA